MVLKLCIRACDFVPISCSFLPSGRTAGGGPRESARAEAAPAGSTSATNAADRGTAEQGALSKPPPLAATGDAKCKSRRSQILLSIVAGVIRSRGDSYVRQSSDWSRKQFLVSNFGRRAARPSPEGVVERGRPLIAEQPRNLPERHPRILHVFERQALPQLIHNLLVSRALLGQFARERSLAEAQCLGDVLSPRLAV